MIIYGINPVKEALASNVRVKKVFISDRIDGRIREIVDRANVTGTKVSRKNREFFRESGPKSSQLVAAEIDFSTVPFERLFTHGGEVSGVFLALDLIEDPRNLGAIVRGAVACGINGVIIQSRRSCGITSTVFSASAGAVAHIRVSEVPNIKNAINVFREEGFKVIGADSSGSELYWDVDYLPPSVIVMGSEGKGLRKTVKTLCDVVVKIPMEMNIASLNVSVASGIILYEAYRQIKYGGR